MSLGRLGEFGLLAELARLLPQSAPDLIRAIGDDCAVIASGDEGALLLTTDLLVEGVHFLPGSDPRRLGRKALAASLSDVAAMGGRSRFALLGLSAPASTDLGWLRAVVEGLGELAATHAVAVIGGDTTASMAGVTLAVTVLGEARRDSVLLRSGGGVGDLLYLSRPVGDSAAGLALLGDDALGGGLDAAVRAILLARHLDPEAEVAAGVALGVAGGVSAMIDVSDGLGQDLGHVCRHSGVGAEILAHNLPLSAELRAFAQATGDDPVRLAVGSGEEYALLFAVPPLRAGALADALAVATGRRPTCIGRLVAGDGVTLEHPDGSRERVDGAGHDHFREAQD